MRNVATALCLFASLSLACASRPSQDEAPEAAPMEQTPPPEGWVSADGRTWDQLTADEQEEYFRVQQHISNARASMAEGRNDEARAALTRALELEPDNAEALALQGELDAAVTADAEIPAAPAQTEAERAEIAKTKAEEGLRTAKVQLARGEVDAAILELEMAQDTVRFAPPEVEWEGVDSEIETLLADAREQQTALARQTSVAAQRETRDELRRREEAERQARRQRVNNLMDQAIEAFRAQRYDDAIDLTEEALKIEPRNERAQDLRDTSERAKREKVQENYLRSKREQYLRWQEDMDDLRTPNTEIVTLPDEDYWRDVTERRSKRRGLDLSRDIPASELELRSALATTMIQGLQISEEESLTAVIDALRAITGLPMIVDPAAEAAASDEGVVFDLDLSNPLSAEKALNLLTGMAGPSVTWTVRHDTILITTKEKARGSLVIINHDVQDLIFGLTDFLGPRIGQLRLLDQIEDDDGGGLFGGLGEKPVLNEPDDLETLIRDNVAVGTWEEEGISITLEAGNMIVVHTPEVQQQVRLFLEDLRRFSSSLVTIESKFLTISDNFIQEIGVEFRGLDNSGSPFTDLDDIKLGDDPTVGLDNNGNPTTPTAPSAGFFYDDGADGDFKGRTEHIFESALGDALNVFGGLTAQYTFLNDLQASVILRMVEKSQNVELINDQMLSVHNTQRAFVTVINQRAYVQDFEVEVAQFQAIADPVINVLTEGIVLDVRPTIHHSRRQITLEIQPTVAQVVSLSNFTTSLSGSTQPVTFQLPELEVQSVFTTAIVPDGGTILLGGLSRLRNIERRAEVPWVANIPLVGFFFKEEGYNDERESLMIMIRAWVTDMKEEMEHLAR